MNNILFLAQRYLRFNQIKTAIMVFSIAVAVFLPLVVNLLVRDYQRDLLARAQATPLIAGAPGSRLDLVLHALYFRGQPAHDLTMADVTAINQSGLALAIPILEKHSAQGFPIVGTALEYFNFRGLHVARGEGLTRVSDCVLGAAVAAKLGLKPGDKLMSDPENVFDLAGSYPINMHVKGILAATGTADDGAIFTDYKTEWCILGIMHGHANAASINTDEVLNQTPTNIVLSAAVVPFQEITSNNITLFHVHGDPETFPVTAIIIVPDSVKDAAILRGRYEDPKATVQILVPAQVLSEMLDLVFRVKHFFDAQSLVVGVAMVLLLALVVLLSLRLRHGEMETMFKLGCARGMIFGMQAVEILIVAVIGVALAVAGSWLVVRELGLAGLRENVAEVTSASPTAAAAPEKKKTVAVVNYPLWYFTQRIAGDRVDILFPIPQDDDPAFWHPTDADVAQYQRADLILRNGADYSKWLLTAVLPLTHQVITSAAFADRFLKNGIVIWHSHGKEGLHSHGLVDFNTWIDPTLAAQQAQCIHDQLVKLLPADAQEFDANLEKLKADLAALDAHLAAAVKPLRNVNVLASHPVYHYLARRYGMDMKEVEWEPEEMPSAAEWTKFDQLYATHPSKIMIWEAEPLPAVVARLRQMGIEPVAFETCANKPDSGDYFTAMNANADRLAAALAVRLKAR